MGKGAGAECRVQMPMTLGDVSPFLELPWDRLESLTAGVDAGAAVRLKKRMSRRGVRDRELYLPSMASPIAQPEVFRGLFDGFEHEPSGLRTVLPDIDPDFGGAHPNPHYRNGYLTLHFEIHADGAPVGIGNYDLDMTDDGTLYVRVCNLRLRQNQETDPARRFAFMGRGFGAALQAHLEEALRGHGVDRMTLTAVNEGGYVWGRYGYLFDPRYPEQLPTPQARMEAVARGCLEHMSLVAEDLRQQGKIPASVQRQVRRLVRADQIPLTPGELGQIGREHPFDMPVGGGQVRSWLGRETMAGTSYRAVKLL